MTHAEVAPADSAPPGIVRATLIAVNVVLHTVCHDLVTAWNAVRPSSNFHNFSTSIDHWIPYLGWTWIFYYFGDLYIFLWGSCVVWKMPSRQFYRAVAVYSIMIVLGALTHFVVPAYSPWPDHPSPIQVWFHEHITFDPNVCLPSMHVALTVLPTCMTFDIFSSRTVKILAFLSAVLITVSTLTLKEHYAMDAIAGLVLALVSYVVWKLPDRRTRWPLAKSAVSGEEQHAKDLDHGSRWKRRGNLPEIGGAYDSRCV
jgi:membrane-associated phospholipid phosphatase